MNFIIIMTMINNFLTNIKKFISYADQKVPPITDIISKSLSLDMNVFSGFLTRPLNFMFCFICLTTLSLFCMNDFICNIFAIIYPSLYIHEYYLKIRDSNNHSSNPMLEYWMIYALLLTIQQYMEFILLSIPGFYYMKMAFLYTLMRNNFYFAHQSFYYIFNFYFIIVGYIKKLYEYVKQYIQRFLPIDQEIIMKPLDITISDSNEIKKKDD